MPIAAVPSYLGSKFDDASPALRFGALLPIWTTRADQEDQVRSGAQRRSPEGQELQNILERQGMDAAIAHYRAGRGKLPGLWEKNDAAANASWAAVCRLHPSDLARMEALVHRQRAMLATLPQDRTVCVEAIATAPFTTGLGNAHPLENGFAFLNPYGLPYLAGSGVKGVLRTAAEELSSGEWGEAHGWGRPYADARSEKRFGIALSAIDLLFGVAQEAATDEHLRGALQFWDVIPQMEKALHIEVMTPHQTHYYQPKSCGRDVGTLIPPHDSGQPTPLHFLTLPPGTRFSFFVTCERTLLQRHAPELVRDDLWKTILQAAMEHAFAWLGFGAKTAVGYGAMALDRAALERQAREKAAAEETQRRAQMTPAQRHVAEYIDYMQKRFEELRGRPARIGAEYQRTKALAQTMESEEWTPEERRLAAKAIDEWLPKVVIVDMKQERKKLNLRQWLAE
ncbi:type III-B CRISPR module RAMP protein Cmr6 [Acidithiobacillus caldus]